MLHRAVLLVVSYSLSILLFFLVFHVARVFNRWSALRMRHRFFFVWTLAFLGVLAGLLLTGMFQSYDKDGPQILTFFFVCNYYVISLQILWRLSMGQMSAVTKAVLDVKEDIRDGVIKSVDQSATLNSSQIPDDVVEVGQNVVAINRTLSENNKESTALLTEPAADKKGELPQANA